MYVLFIIEFIYLPVLFIFETDSPPVDTDDLRDSKMFQNRDDENYCNQLEKEFKSSNIFFKFHPLKYNK